MIKQVEVRFRNRIFTKNKVNWSINLSFCCSCTVTWREKYPLECPTKIGKSLLFSFIQKFNTKCRVLDQRSVFERVCKLEFFAVRQRRQERDEMTKEGRFKEWLAEQVHYFRPYVVDVFNIN